MSRSWAFALPVAAASFALVPAPVSACAVCGCGDATLTSMGAEAPYQGRLRVSLEARYRDHDLSGDWAGYRECHIKPDLLLIYRKSEPSTLRLARLGSHSELFG